MILSGFFTLWTDISNDKYILRVTVAYRSIICEDAEWAAVNHFYFQYKIRQQQQWHIFDGRE